MGSECCGTDVKSPAAAENLFAGFTHVITVALGIVIAIVGAMGHLKESYVLSVVSGLGLAGPIFYSVKLSYLSSIMTSVVAGCVFLIKYLDTEERFPYAYGTAFCALVTICNFILMPETVQEAKKPTPFGGIIDKPLVETAPIKTTKGIVEKKTD